MVASAGNGGVEGGLYPAAYDAVVAVAAVDALGQHLFFSNRGPEVDIAIWRGGSSRNSHKRGRYGTVLQKGGGFRRRPFRGSVPGNSPL